MTTRKQAEPAGKRSHRLRNDANWSPGCLWNGLPAPPAAEASSWRTAPSPARAAPRDRARRHVTARGGRDGHRTGHQDQAGQQGVPLRGECRPDRRPAAAPPRNRRRCRGCPPRLDAVAAGPVSQPGAVSGLLAFRWEVPAARRQRGSSSESGTVRLSSVSPLAVAFFAAVVGLRLREASPPPLLRPFTLRRRSPPRGSPVVPYGGRRGFPLACSRAVLSSGTSLALGAAFCPPSPRYRSDAVGVPLTCLWGRRHGFRREGRSEAS